MSEDSFIREVDEELRHDQLKNIWDRFGNYLIAIAVLIVLFTAGYRGWDYYNTSRAASSGDRYMEAVELAGQDKHDEALAVLAELESEGSGQYPGLARLRAAAEIARKGEFARAIEAFDAIADSASLDPVLRTVARLRAGLLAVDHESYESARARLEPLAGSGQPFRALAREALGLAALKAGEDKAAHGWFRQIVDDVGAGQNVKSRANIMLDLLAGRGVSGAG